MLTIAHRKAVDANELKTAFLTKVSHELRTPLNHVIGMTAALQETALDAEQLEYAGYVATVGEKLSSMVERLLDLSAVEAGNFVPPTSTFDVAAMVDDIVQDLLGSAEERGLRVDVTCNVDLGVRSGDRAGLRRVLLELIDNAIRFTHSGGARVELELTADDMVRIAVADTGSGIPDAARAKIFGLFGQVDDSLTRAHEGLGVGLALVQGIVSRMGGTVGLETEADKGSRFWVDLPLQRA